MAYRPRANNSTGNMVAFSTSPALPSGGRVGETALTANAGANQQQQPTQPSVHSGKSAAHERRSFPPSHAHEHGGGPVDEEDGVSSRNMGSSTSLTSGAGAGERGGSPHKAQAVGAAPHPLHNGNGPTSAEASAVVAAFTHNLQSATRSASEPTPNATANTTSSPANFSASGSFTSALGSTGQQTPQQYKGVTLLPGIEHIQLDDGTYMGTVDTEGHVAGYGKATWLSGDEYEGEWLNDRMHGNGVYRWQDGDYYQGQYVNGYMNGVGEMKDWTGLYTGEWVDDLRQGHGKMQYTDGRVYVGEWLGGMRHGHGKLTETNGAVYEGEFVRNEKEGKGVLTDPNGNIYDGDFASGKPNGRGTFIWHDGAKYVGYFKDGLRHGEGCEWLPNGEWIAGNFVNGDFNEDQVVRHKPIASDFQEPELPDTVASVLEPLDARKLRKLTHAAAAAERRMGRGGNAAAAEEEGDASHHTDSNSTSERRRDSRRSRGSASNGSSETAAGGRRASKGTKSFLNAMSSSTNSENPQSPFAVALRPTQFSEKDLENWTQLKIIGKGSFGAVYEALLTSGRTVCCKVIELGNVESCEELDKLKNEIALMKRMHHPNIVQYHGSTEDKEKNTMNIFMELVSGGSLNSFVKKFKTIPMQTMRQWTYQMVCGVKYLHDCGIVHRDIKGDNVLVSLDGIVKLADFGCSKSIEDACSATHGCATMVGTPYWMAPEVIKCEAGGYGAKSDVWSIGCTIVEMITGKPPWPECNSMWAAVYKIANSTGLPTEIPTDLDPQLMNLLERCFERDPRKRASAAELLEHPFLAEIADAAMGGS